MDGKYVSGPLDTTPQDIVVPASYGEKIGRPKPL